MSLNKKLLAGAIAGVLFSANAAAVNLGVDPARVYAAEMVAPVDLSADTGDTVDFTTGYNFSPGEVRYGRFECTSNMTMDNAVLSEADGTIDLGSINGQGTPALFFSMTANTTAADTDVITVDADNTLLNGSDVTCSFSIYDQPSQAQAGGITGRIYSSGFKPFITRATSFTFEATPGSATADVEAANGAYTDFIGGNTIGALEFALAVPTPLLNDGNPIALTDIFSTDTFVTIDGDLSAAANAPGDFQWNGISADAIDDSSAEFDIGNAATTGNLDFVSDLATAITEGEYTATLHADTNTGFAVADVGPLTAGEIVRNGTQLQAPLANVPAGWISRMVLTNTGGTARSYEISIMGEAGNTIGTANLTGTVPANGTKVVDLNTVMTSFTGKARGTVNVTVAAPDKQIQGLLQIVSDAGSISNHVMVRPGTN